MERQPEDEPEASLTEAEAAFLAGWFAAKGIAHEDITREQLAEAGAALSRYNAQWIARRD